VGFIVFIIYICSIIIVITHRILMQNGVSQPKMVTRTTTPFRCHFMHASYLFSDDDACLERHYDVLPTCATLLTQHPQDLGWADAGFNRAVPDPTVQVSCTRAAPAQPSELRLTQQHLYTMYTCKVLPCRTCPATRSAPDPGRRARRG